MKPIFEKVSNKLEYFGVKFVVDLLIDFFKFINHWPILSA